MEPSALEHPPSPSRCCLTPALPTCGWTLSTVALRPAVSTNHHVLHYTLYTLLRAYLKNIFQWLKADIGIQSLQFIILFSRYYILYTRDLGFSLITGMPLSSFGLWETPLDSAHDFFNQLNYQYVKRLKDVFTEMAPDVIQIYAIYSHTQTVQPPAVLHLHFHQSDLLPTLWSWKP